MIEMRHEPFIGLHLFIRENRLQDRGTIIECTYNRNGIMTFFTEMGEYSLFYPKGARYLHNGYWRILGDKPRWAYVGPPWTGR